MKEIKIKLKDFKKIKSKDYKKLVEYIIIGKRRTAKIFYEESSGFNIHIFSNITLSNNNFNIVGFRKSVHSAYNYISKNM